MHIGTLGHTYLYNTQSNKLLKRNEKFMVEIQVKQQQKKYNEKSMTKKLRGQNCAKC